VKRARHPGKAGMVFFDGFRCGGWRWV